MIYKTRDFGEREIPDSKVLIFKQPIFGFDNYTRFTLIFDEESTINAIADNTTDKDFENFDFDRIVQVIRQLPATYTDVMYLNIVT